MKFDLILSNPPYQNSVKQGNKLWMRFSFKAVDCLKDGGWLAMITPSSWMTGGNNIGNRGLLKTIFAEKQLIIADVSGAVNKCFPGVGVQISWWILQNVSNTRSSMIKMADETLSIHITDQTVFSSTPNSISNSILTKYLTSSDTRFETHYFHTAFTPGSKDESEFQNEVYHIPHWVMGSDRTKDLYITYLNQSLSEKLGFKKILIPKGSRYWQPFFDDEKCNVAREGFAYPIEDEWTRETVYSVFYSKLFTFIGKNLQLDYNGWMKTTSSLPKLDLSRTWTDEELYAHFGLTEEEVAYIERQVR